jgi:hypothetical protein
MRDRSSPFTASPIAVFAYRRTKSLQSMFESLVNCDGFEKSEITIFVDGFKSEVDRKDVQEVQAFARGLAFPNVRAVLSAENRGLRRSIYQGVGSLVRRHGRVIVLEDDLELSPMALRYFNAALDAYANVERVKAVCGYMYDLDPPQPGACFFLPFASSWGWATWNRAWNGFSVETDDYRALSQSASFQRLLGAPKIARMNLMLDAQVRGLIDSWAILWNAYIAKQGGICLFPPSALVGHRGFSAVGSTHSSRNPLNTALSRMEAQMELAQSFVLPDRVELDFSVVDRVASAAQARLQRVITVLGYVRRRARAILAS